ncbi:MAG: hypothetical protein JO033_07800 [Acidobacteriaceae bacterium]|nr:hypothetical protein [Acidobacteriaceae bacterium]
MPLIGRIAAELLVTQNAMRHDRDHCLFWMGSMIIVADDGPGIASWKSCFQPFHFSSELQARAAVMQPTFL